MKAAITHVHPKPAGMPYINTHVPALTNTRYHIHLLVLTTDQCEGTLRRVYSHVAEVSVTIPLRCNRNNPTRIYAIHFSHIFAINLPNVNIA